MNKANGKEREQSCYLTGWIRGIFVTQITTSIAQNSEKGSPHQHKTTNFQDPSHGSALCRDGAKDQHGASRLRATAGNQHAGSAFTSLTPHHPEDQIKPEL